MEGRYWWIKIELIRHTQKKRTVKSPFFEAVLGPTLDEFANWLKARESQFRGVEIISFTNALIDDAS